MRVWPVFVLAEMHLDEGESFSIGDSAAWPVLVRDGRQTGCPWYVLKPVEVQLVAYDRPGSRSGCLAEMPDLAAWWVGRERPGSTFTIPAYLGVDIWQRPPTTVSGTVRRIRRVSSGFELDGAGVWRPTGPWILTDVQEASKRFVRKYEDPGAIRDVGILVDLDVSSFNVA